ncbi:MAG: type II toxin-antitoxin system RelE/ParE family toxin [Roseovarius sp.]|nr:type II toxin-antitoxin system RelE/ParE family toxin [Roseovarius sp.]
MAKAELPLRLTPQAQTDLEDIWLYSAQTWSPDQADTYLDGLGESMNALCAMPTMAREYPEFSPTVRIHPNGSHLIIYRIDADTLDVIRILGARQNWKAILDRIDG